MPPLISPDEQLLLNNILGGDVSHETQEKLAHYAYLLEKWQKKINLVSTPTIAHLWRRHIIDSAQIIPLLNSAERLVIMDIGSGAGFPGLVLALLTPHQLHLVESDAKKCAFMRRVIGETGSTAIVHTSRIEDLSFIKPDVITARALASLEKLLVLTQRQHHETLRCIFLKGRSAQQEKDDLTGWSHLTITDHNSATDPQASILTVSGF
jgi:16S rRNA (guanine527-N7)-methyltransferase